MYLKDTRFCAIDLETTGLDPKSDEIIAFACVPVEGLRIMIKDAFYTLIKPERFNVSAMKYHGISNGDLETAQTFGEAAEMILSRTDGVMLGYAVDFDHKLLARSFKNIGISYERERIDVMLIEKWLGRKSGHMGEDLNFDAMMTRYGLKEYYRHNALADAFFVAQIFQLQALKLTRLGVDTLKKLEKAVKSCRYALW